MEETGESGKRYYWAYAIYQGRLLIDGWYADEQQAYEFARRRIPVKFEVIALNTYNRQSATQKIKHEVLEQTGDIDFALQRAKHKY
jgi:ribosomal protein L16/L10AE